MDYNWSFSIKYLSKLRKIGRALMKSRLWCSLSGRRGECVTEKGNPPQSSTTVNTNTDAITIPTHIYTTRFPPWHLLASHPGVLAAVGWRGVLGLGEGARGVRWCGGPALDHGVSHTPAGPGQRSEKERATFISCLRRWLTRDCT